MEAKGFGVTAAPTFFINGRKLVGARSVSDFQRIIDEELGLTKTVQVPQLQPSVPSRPPVVEIDIGDAPVKGPQDAPIVIVEFSDFQCPFCARALPTVENVLQRYPNQVRWVFKHFPLDFHADAPLAHAAALAAREQGKFWEMHDLIFLRQRAMKRNHLIQYARELRLDVDQFIADMDSGKYRAQIDQDIVEGRRLGVNGTPTFFVNGQRLVGARPMSDFVTLIENQLRSARRQSLPHDVPTPSLAPPSELSALGPASALVQVEAFMDLASPLSAQTLSVLKAIQGKHPSEVRLAIRHLPQAFHPEARLIHQAALAAGEQGKYWEMQELMVTQRGRLDRATFVVYARELALDEAAFTDALDQQKYGEILEQDRAAGLQRDVRGVPTVFVNGRRLDGVPSLKVLSEWVEHELRQHTVAAQTEE